MKYCILIPAIFLLLSCGPKTETVSPEKKPLLEAVYASGFVVSKEEYEVFATAEGVVLDKPVPDGEQVRKGDVLYVLEADQQTARNAMAKSNYELALKNSQEDSPVLNELKALVENSRTKMLHDSINFRRYENLWDKQATSRAEYDRSKLAWESSSNEYRLQVSRLKKLRDQLKTELQNAKDNLAITTDERERYLIRSSVDGVVFQTTKEKGELIRRNESVAIVGKAGEYYLRLTIDEMDIEKVRPRQKIMVKIDAFADKVFKAEVEKVYPLVDRKQQSVRVDAKLLEPLPTHFSGLAVEANIVIQEKQETLVIPKRLLLPGDTVLIATDDGVRKIRVKTGIQTLEEIEILDGLDTTSRMIAGGL